MTTLNFRKSIGRSLSWRCGFVLVPLAVLCFGLSPTAKALLPPPVPDGGYPGGNTAEGINALHDVNTAVGINNTAVGANALTHDTTGFYNVAIGEAALASNTTGNFNMAIGTEALTNNNANFNLAIGFRVGFMNTTGNHLTGIGAAALRNNTTGSQNTAIGADALRDNTAGGANTAIGAGALLANTADQNTATGAGALLSNTTGFGNTAVGYQALFSKTSGSGNTAVGDGALYNITGGENNIGLGSFAGFGNSGGGSNNIYIGNEGGLDSGTIRIGIPGVQTRTFIAGISGTAIVTGAPVTVDANGQLGVGLSSRRFKKEIKPMDKASEAILALKPVIFEYKSDDANTPQFGLIAEEVAEVNPDLVVRDKDGEIYTVRYDAVNAMLLNEFLKEHRENEEQQATIAELKSELRTVSSQQRSDIQTLTVRLEQQAAQIQKVSAQLELRGSAAQLAAENP